MIRITKGVEPLNLITTGVRQRDELCDLYITDRPNYNNGTFKFTFSNAYKTDAVWNALNRDQHGKCCFTEAKFVADESHVEHFRPKGRVDEWPVGSSSYPGYYWLAYEWTNLFLCKSFTNSSMKRNFFPLVTGNVRNRNHLDRRVENPILINPAIEDPRLHLCFNKAEIKGITRRGKKNIKILDLRNPQLDEARRTKYELLSGLKGSTELLLDNGIPITNPIVVNNLNLLRASIRQNAEFSSMAIDLLTGWPHL